MPATTTASLYMTGGRLPPTPEAAFQRSEPVAGSIPQTVPSSMPDHEKAVADADHPRSAPPPSSGRDRVARAPGCGPLRRAWPRRRRWNRRRAGPPPWTASGVVQAAAMGKRGFGVTGGACRQPGRIVTESEKQEGSDEGAHAEQETIASCTCRPSPARSFRSCGLRSRERPGRVHRGVKYARPRGNLEGRRIVAAFRSRERPWPE